MGAALRHRLGHRLRDPIIWNDALQLFKTALAAVVAWVLAAGVLDLPQPFLAPWAALLVVHATVYRTVSRGLKQVTATVAAVLLAAAVGQLLGLSTVAIAVLLVVGLLLGALPWFGAEALTVATTALVVLTTGFADDLRLVARLLDTGIGVGVGLLVNLALWPPLRRRTAVAAMDRIDDGIGQLLEEIGQRLADSWDETDVESWVEQTRDLDAQLDRAWALVRQARESSRMNFRRSAREVRDPKEWYQLLHRMEQGVAEVRSMARTLGGQLGADPAWDRDFARAWTDLLVDAGRAVAAAEPRAIRAVRGRLERLVTAVSRERLTAHWPVQGALAVNLRNLLDAMEEVAAANPMRPHLWPWPGAGGTRPWRTARDEGIDRMRRRGVRLPAAAG